MKIKCYTDKEVETRMCNLSIEHGGAWIACALPFSQPGDEVNFIRYSSPCKVPDEHYDRTHNRIAYKGQIVGFTSAAIIREQNRGMGSN
ncbi:MAG: hypothetical protein WC364_13030 [Eubacteriales bacterium]|jgi:hypothetical protein